ncbi:MULTISPECIES: DUF6844 domain-containing protein [unclassified Lentimicrobium]|uniref:DUF6844 domain-containing protein n=1 Tax=unclassified Lentimicrobium TaxID=2677434 RepID=UPI0015532F14|nr:MULTISPECIES: hypothetical protein [unclassified Lentimicrobium]NPD47143.1 hypothetical protein [Lentimicrobium sp. S6]NPD86774.1 hypothetical protein [Lentimicrobium sp. L6]
MKKIVLSLLFVGMMGFTFAQNPADLAKTDAVTETQEVQTEMVEYPEDVLRDKISSVLVKKGKSLGSINSDGSIYIVAAATTARPSNMTGFINSRNIAYNIAELTAKMNLLRMAGEQITSGRGFTMLEDIIEGEDPDASSKASMLDKAIKVLDQSLDKALEYVGVSEEEIAKMNESEKHAAYEQNFNQTVKSLVAGMVKGCATVMIAEGDAGNDDYQIAVCMKYSPEFQSLASIIKSNTSYQTPIGKVKNSVEKIKGMPEDKLVGKLGAQVTFNSSGEMIIFGYGQQEVRSSGSRQSAAFSRAYSQARLNAVNNIKNFVAEDLVAEESLQNVEKLKEYDDGTQAYYSRQKWEQAVKAKESTLNLATTEIRQWKGKHPVSGHDIAGYVVAWTPSNAAQANQLQKDFQKKEDAISPDGRNAEQQRQQTKKSKTIVTGDEDDI